MAHRAGWLALGLLTTVAARPAVAAEIEIGPDDDIVDAVAALAPGDELILQGGTYAMDRRFGVTLHGTAVAPIVIRAKEGEEPIIERPDASQNIIDLDDASYLIFRGLVFDGGSHGIRLIDARFITIEDCEIRNTDDVALSANSGGDYEALTIRRNHIHHTDHTGEGMYLGCNENACRVFDSVIEQNYIHHTNGPTVEQGDGIELKEGSYNNIIRDNVIHDTNYPCILTYSTVGNGAPNIIERNVMWNCGDHAIQSAADAVIRNNIILSANADGIAMQSHQNGSPSNHVVVHNTVLQASGDAISLRDTSGAVLIANNAVYAQGGRAIFVGGGDTSALQIAGNVGVGGLEGASDGLTEGALGADFVAAHFDGAPPIDVFPASGSALVAAGDSAHVADLDFNGTPRNGVADVGAYAYAEAGNPGWTLGESFKDGVAPAGPGGSGPGIGATGEPDESGCGCRLGARAVVGGASWAWSLLLLGALRRRTGRRRYIVSSMRPW